MATFRQKLEAVKLPMIDFATQPHRPSDNVVYLAPRLRVVTKQQDGAA